MFRAFLTVGLYLFSSIALGYQSFEDLGVLSSLVRREPQVIRIELTMYDTFVFKFCPNIESNECEYLGSEKGYSSTSLDKLSKKSEMSFNVFNKLSPVLEISPYLGIAATISMLPITSVPVIILLAISASQLGEAMIRERKSSLKILNKIKDVVDPDSINSPLYLKNGVSIVAFSYILEKMLWRIDNCRLGSRGTRCKQMRREVGLPAITNKTGKRRMNKGIQ